VYFAPVVRRQLPVIAIPKPSLLPFLLLLIGPLLFYFSPEPNIDSQPLSLQHLSNYPTTTSQFNGAQINPDVKNARETKQIHLDGIALQIDLFTHIPGSKTEEIVPYIGRLINSAQWINEKQSKIATPGEQQFELEVFRRVGQQGRILIAKQYVIGQHQTSSYVYAKFIQILAKAAGDNYFGLLMVQTSCEADCANEINQI